jgi:hypothetical protein
MRLVPFIEKGRNRAGRRWFALCNALTLALTFLAVPFGVLTFPPRASGIESETQRFQLDEALRAWALQKNQLLDRRVLISISVASTSPRSNGQSTDYTFLANKNCKLVIEQPRSPKDDRAFLFALNPAYGFVLCRAHSAAPWLLESVARANADPADETLARINRKLEVAQRRSACLVHTYLGADSFEEMVSDPQFKLLALDRPAGLAPATVKFEFKHPIQPGPKGFFNPVQGGSLQLDPEHGWSLLSAEYRVSYGDGEGKCEIHASSTIDEKGIRWPSTLVLKEDIHLNKSQSRLQHSYVATFQFESASPHDSDFTLTAFGLPEPLGITWKRPTPWYAWVIGGGIILLVVGFGCGYLRRRYLAKLARA